MANGRYIARFHLAFSLRDYRPCFLWSFGTYRFYASHPGWRRIPLAKTLVLNSAMHSGSLAANAVNRGAADLQGLSTEAALCSGCAIVIELSVSLHQCRLCPGPSKVQQTLPLFGAFGVAGRKNGLFGVLPEFVCFRHGTPSVCPDTHTHTRTSACLPRDWPAGQNCSPGRGALNPSTAPVDTMSNWRGRQPRRPTAPDFDATALDPDKAVRSTD
jgi:hypothetical protein